MKYAPTPGMRVFVYYNLHRKLWSIRALEGPKKGLVVARERWVELKHVVPRVSEAGRQRVLRERKKNVHAGLTGTWEPSRGLKGVPVDYRTISYNPLTGPKFYYKDTREDFERAERVTMIALEGQAPRVLAHSFIDATWPCENCGGELDDNDTCRV